MKNIKLLFAAFLLLGSSVTLSAQEWKSDPSHSQLGFSISHLLINKISGAINDFSITLTATKPDFSDASILLSAKLSSIYTGVDRRDNHLKGADFFNADIYPELTFTSTSVEVLTPTTYKVHGNLTMHGVTKPVDLDVSLGGTVVNPMNKKETAGFKITGTIKRSDFSIGSGFAASTISDDVKVVANVEMQKQ